MNNTRKRRLYLIAINDSFPLEKRYAAIRKMQKMNDRAADASYYKRKRMLLREVQKHA